MIRLLRIPLFFVFAIAAAIFVWFVFWFGSAGDCFMYVAEYHKIKTIIIDEKKYYIYESISGGQEKTRFISMSEAELPDFVCDYSSIKKPIYSSDLDDDKKLKKILLYRKAGGEFFIDLVYYENNLVFGGDSDGINIEVK